jgi:hypothetical protein
MPIFEKENENIFAEYIFKAQQGEVWNHIIELMK